MNLPLILKQGLWLSNETDLISFITHIIGLKQTQTKILSNFNERFWGRGSFSTHISMKERKKVTVNDHIISCIIRVLNKIKIFTM